MAKRTWLWGSVAAVSALALGGGVWLFSAQSSDPVVSRGILDYRCEDMSKVYLGRPPVMRRPAVVDSTRAYANIPEYAQARALPADEPRHHFLLKAASDRFLEALRGVAGARGHDVVAEVGAIQPQRPGVPPPTDLTDALLAALAAR